MAVTFSSPLAPSIEGLVRMKRAQGYKYEGGAYRLSQLDRYAIEHGWESPVVGRELAEGFSARRPDESWETTFGRRSAVRELASWQLRRGLDAYVLPSGGKRPPGTGFTPVILTEDEVRRLLAAADSMPPTTRSPLRHLVVPALLRTLYACGLRIGEALTLTVADVDLEAGLLTIRPENAKFNKGRTLPMSDTLVKRLDAYDAKVGVRGPTAPFFPSPSGFYDHSTICRTFHGLLAAAGIPHTDDGPTIHSLRHTFACHCIMRWAREGANINANLPFLSAYLGHEGIEGTERYVRLTVEMLPDLRSTIEDKLSWIIPGTVT